MIRYFVFILFLSHSAHSQIESILSGSLVGYQLAGLQGAAWGTGAGCVDELLLSSGFSEEPYLVPALIGIASLKQLPLSKATRITGGAILGYLLIDDQLDNAWGMFSTSVHAGALGYQFGRFPGALLGTLLGSLSPKTPIFKNILEANAFNKILPRQSFYTLSLLSTIFFAKENLQNRAESASIHPLQNSLKNLFEDLGEPSNFNRLNFAHTEFVLSSQLLLMDFMKNSFPFYTAIWEQANRLERPAYLQAVQAYLCVLLTEVLLKVGTDTASLHNRNQILAELENRTQNRYLNETVMMKLPSLNQSDVRIHNLFAQLDQSIRNAYTLLDSHRASRLALFYHLGTLFSHDALDAVYLLSGTEECISLFFDWLGSQMNGDYSWLQVLNSKITILQQDLMTHAAPIYLANQSNHVIHRLTDLIPERQKSFIRTDHWSSLKTICFESLGSLRYVLKYLFISLLGNKPTTHTHLIADSIFHVANSLGWQSKFSSELNQTSQILAHLKQAIETLQQPLETPTALISYETSHPLSLSLEDFSFGVATKTFSHSVSIHIPQAYYVLSGLNGCGKSTFFKILLGFRDNRLWSEGRILWNTEGLPRIAAVPQETYLLPDSNLYEAIGIEDQDAERIACDELALCQDWNEMKTRWSDSLSGGEKKKLALLKAVLLNPDILLLDETFGPMDPTSRQLAQELIQKRLPTALLISIDHQAQDSNAFYAAELRLENQKLLFVDP
ncbi:MAG: ATP-binding cassette domain-containing protein [Myxococcaceae bacterium]|nr:ATP-binding cassette domain-containing protein [Myxococcaceae bacterium]MBH2006034.1 ATP-binding cassette domain-containing protein [Myxococcaceae bacterium]